jgi:hypothetical protein
MCLSKNRGHGSRQRHTVEKLSQDVCGALGTRWVSWGNRILGSACFEGRHPNMRAGFCMHDIVCWYVFVFKHVLADCLCQSFRCACLIRKGENLLAVYDKAYVAPSLYVWYRGSCGKSVGGPGRQSVTGPGRVLGGREDGVLPDREEC